MVEQISRLRKLKVVMPEVTHILENNTPNTTMDDPNLEFYAYIGLILDKSKASRLCFGISNLISVKKSKTTMIKTRSNDCIFSKYNVHKCISLILY